jgi:hypothetical protein
MTSASVEAVISAQQALIAALDGRDAAAIVNATHALAETVAMLRAQDGWRESRPLRDRISHALKQSDAARIRINYLADWTRQRIDSIAELRGGGLPPTYAKPCKTKGNIARI